ncbi:hypothetical protein N7530_000284 [Penicillium desertorum]|uniref:Uncharacterized protein n=1 Tax=Penicillium desertorum TaxID=1303715 RepID=A0A9X0BV92_9EURO|nr:hypothetical protein N7530_000284 [Penicillium desertorum]
MGNRSTIGHKGQLDVGEHPSILVTGIEKIQFAPTAPTVAVIAFLRNLHRRGRSSSEFNRLANKTCIWFCYALDTTIPQILATIAALHRVFLLYVLRIKVAVRGVVR